MSATDHGTTPMPWYLHPYFAAVLTATALVLSSFVLKRVDPQGATRVAASLVVVPPTVFLVWTFVRWIRGLDELEHRIVFEAVAIAFSLSFLLAVAMEGLQNGGIITHFDWEHAWVGMALLYVAAYAWARRRYQ